jgi:GntR family transcriptional regulator, transcriptional repressor for pyruvate dehydrogenase complex
VPQKEAANGNLSDYVSQHLIDYIRTNQLRSGAEVPSEMRVSSDLGISRGIVREAFRALKMAGVIEISNGRLPRVGRINDEGIAQVLQHALSTDQATIEQVLDLRAAIEIRGAELAAKHRTAQDVEALRREVGNMQVFKTVQNRFIDADARFHETIAQSTGNPLFAVVGSALRGSLTASIRAGLRNRTTVRQLDQIVATHKAIADAISDQDAVRARKYMAIHFDEALRSFGLKASRYA